MNEDLLAEAGRFHAYAQAMKQELNALTSVVPDRPRGTDSTGAVTVTVGSENELVDVYVSDDWDRTLQPTEVGAAIVQAAQSAEISRATESVSAAIDSGALRRLIDMRLDDFPATPIESAPVRADLRPSPSPDQLVDEALALSERAQTPSEDAQVYVGESEEAEGWVAVALSTTGALVGCTIGPYWATGRSGSSISWAVNESAAIARRKLTDGTGAGSGLSDSERIISDAIRLITQLGQ